MDRFEAAWENNADPHVAPGADSAAGWPESVWSAPGGVLDDRTELFADPFAESELRREMRLSELWDRCADGSCTLREFFELSTLITEVQAIRSDLCEDCATLRRPDAPAHWSLAATRLCRSHLRFHLGHARLDGEGGALRP